MLEDTPRVLWGLQDLSGNPQDSSGNALHATSVGAEATHFPADLHPAQQQSLGCILLPTATTVVRSSVVSTVTDNLTMEVVVMVMGQTQGGRIMGNNGPPNGYLLHLAATRKFQITCPNVLALPVSTTQYTRGRWYHVAARRASNQWRYIINGAEDATDPGTSTPNTPASGEFGIGESSGANAMAVAFAAMYETAISTARLLERAELLGLA